MKPQTAICKSQAELARRLGVSRQLVGYHSRQPGCPSKLDVQSWKDYLASLTPRLPGVFSKADKARVAALKIRLLEAQVEREERTNQLAAGRLIDFETAHQQVREGVYFLFSELERTERELPPILDGRPALEIAETLAKAYSGIKANARLKFDGIGQQEK